MTILNEVFKPFIESHRYKVAKGGRGSGKSWAFARLLVEIARRGNYRFLCAREFQNSIADSVIQLIADTIEREGYLNEFEVQKNYIRHRLTHSLFMFYGIKNNVTKIKSLEGIDICWVEEAEAVTKSSWDVLIPTIRKPSSEIWVSFNPKNILDDTYQRFVVHPPEDICMLTVNWQDNPHFPDVLRKEMEECKTRNFDLYRHIWEGEPVADSEMSIIKPIWLDDAVDAHKIIGFTPSGIRCVGFDVADEGEDANAMAFRHGSVLLAIDQWREGDVLFSAAKVHQFATSNWANKIIYDSIGVGAGVKAYFNRNTKISATGFNAGDTVKRPESLYAPGKKNKDMFSNLKIQCWWDLRDRFEETHRLVKAIKSGKLDTRQKIPVDRLISLSSDLNYLDLLKAELSRVQIDYDNNGRAKAESKKDMKKRGIPSTNLADAVVMAFSNLSYGGLLST